jgi:hypothetical protein
VTGKNKAFIALIIILVLFSLLICKFLDNTWLLFLTTFGTLASIAGLLFVIVQIMSLESITKATKETAENTKKELLFNIYLSDIGKTIKLIREIQNYNRDSKFELSILRMQDLLYSLSQIKNHPTFSRILCSDKIKKYIVDINVNISGLEKEIKLTNRSLDTVKLNRSLGKIILDLTDLDIILKQSGGKND